jgi:hypothetical protein
MRLASPFSAGLGSPENMVEYCIPELSQDQTSVRLRFKPRAGWGDAFFAVFMDARQVAHLWCPEGSEQSVRCALPWGSSSASFLALRVGRLADPSLDLRRVARTFETDSRKVSLDLPFDPEVLGAVKGEDNGVYCSNWALTGLDFLRNVTPLKPFKTRAYLDLDLAVSGGNVTVTLSKAGVAVAAGTGAKGGTVTLAEQNGSGLSGSVDVASGVVTTAGAKVYVRWPATVQVLRGATSPPTTVVANVAFNGQNLRRWTEAADLAAGTWYYRVRAVSDTGKPGALTELPFTIQDVPDAPSDLAYKSGNAAATVLQFTPSPTAGATYRAYLQQIGAELIDLENVAATAPAGSNRITLPAITGYPGIARAVVRAVKAGLEERNLDTVELEYDAAGAFVPARPNAPDLSEATEAVTGGLTLDIVATYDPAREKGVATHVHLYKRAPGGSYGGTPDAQADLTQAANGLKEAALELTFGADGWYYVQARAATAQNVESPAAACPEYLVYVADTAPAAPAVEGQVSRG